MLTYIIAWLSGILYLVNQIGVLHIGKTESALLSSPSFLVLYKHNYTQKNKDLKLYLFGYNSLSLEQYP